MRSWGAWWMRPVDLLLTLLYWTYFTAGFVLFFSPFYLWVVCFSRDRERSFQRLNHIFYRRFLAIVAATARGVSFEIPESVAAIRSAVIICNHVSYLDPVLLISLYERHKTIVKSAFFKVPLFGWVLRQTGYLPSEPGEGFSSLMIEQIGGMAEFLALGGNLFVFPEGTRSRDGRVGPFHPGLFKIARHFGAPIKVLYIRNTNRLFAPGKFLFNTCEPTPISVTLIGEVPASDLAGSRAAIHAVSGRIRALMAAHGERGGLN
jgi:1-acyl-sn-glycerol-3-phosphate acyltransferase